MENKKDPLNMSLDDLIEQNKKEAKGPRRSEGGERPRGRGRDSGGGRGRRNAGRNLSVTVDNVISKPSRGRGRGRGGLKPLPTAERDQAAVHGNKAWTHDLYSEVSRPRRRSDLALRDTGTLLNLSNLDFKVTEADITELFGTIGEVLKSGINYELDRPDGTAYVVFKFKADAETAIQRYNNVSLDGKPMLIKIESKGNTLSSGIRVGGGGGSVGNRAFSQAMSDAQGSAGLETGSRQQGGMRSDRIAGRRRGGATGRVQRVVANLDANDDGYMGE